jgi:hypothetical protein
LSLELAWKIQYYTANTKFDSICNKTIPSSDQKEYRIAARTELKEQAKNEPKFISTIITGDESWVFGFNPEMKQQWSQWKTPTSL